jgi:hypothetical protein
MVLGWGWAVVASLVIVLLVVPKFTNKQASQQVPEQTATDLDADAVMRAVNLHLSRTVPAPMEPMITLMPAEESTTNSGGVR